MIRHNFGSVQLVGLSVGTGIAAIVANELYEEFSDRLTVVDLICPGAELATSLWHGTRTKNLREHYRSGGYNHQALQALWGKYDLIKNLDFAGQVPVRVTYSRADTVIVPSEAQKVITKIKATEGSNLTVFSNDHQGHYVTMFMCWITWRIKYRLPQHRRDLSQRLTQMFASTS